MSKTALNYRFAHFLYYIAMAQLNKQLTEAIQRWLGTVPEERDILAGATLLLQLNRNQAMFNTITRKPAKEADRLEYELRKHLRIRLDNMTVSDVIKMETKVMPSAEQVIETYSFVSTDDELSEGRIARGRRSDHDTLPESIQSLWDNNINLYHKIKLLFEELKTMEKSLPCDRYERLKLLDEADKQYRANLEAYDNYIKPSEEAINNVQPEQDSKPDIASGSFVRQVGSARKTISIYRNQLRKLIELKDPKADEIRDKLQDCVRIILNAGAGFSPSMQSALEALGIKF